MLVRKCSTLALVALLLLSVTLASAGAASALVPPGTEFKTIAECRQVTNTPCWQIPNGNWIGTAPQDNPVQVDTPLVWDVEAMKKETAAMPGNISGTKDRPVVAVDMEQVTFPDNPPYLDPVTNRTMVPIRFISEAMGAVVTWNGDDQSVTIAREGLNIYLQIGNPVARVNGKPLTIDAPPIMVPPGRTMVPLRFISEAFGATVDWVGDQEPMPGYFGKYQVWIWVPWGYFGKTGFYERIKTTWTRRD